MLHFLQTRFQPLSDGICGSAVYRLAVICPKHDNSRIQRIVRFQDQWEGSDAPPSRPQFILEYGRSPAKAFFYYPYLWTSLLKETCPADSPGIALL